MPAIRGTDLKDGIRILNTHRDDVFISRKECVAVKGETLKDFNERINRILQAPYVYKWSLQDPSWGDKKDSRIFQTKPVLLPNEKIVPVDGADYYTITEMYVAIHFDSLINWPPKIKCSNEPMEGEWWL